MKFPGFVIASLISSLVIAFTIRDVNTHEPCDSVIGYTDHVLFEWELRFNDGSASKSRFAPEPLYHLIVEQSHLPVFHAL